MKRSTAAPLLMLGAALAFFAAFFLAPFAVVIFASLTNQADQSFTLEHYVKVLADQYHWDVILVTFRIAALTTLVSLLLGYPLAWYLVRVVKWRAWRRACVILLVVPMFTSNIVRSFGWMVLLGRNGLVNQSLVGTGVVDSPVRFLGTELGHQHVVDSVELTVVVGPNCRGGGGAAAHKGSRPGLGCDAGHDALLIVTPAGGEDRPVALPGDDRERTVWGADRLDDGAVLAGCAWGGLCAHAGVSVVRGVVCTTALFVAPARVLGGVAPQRWTER